MLGIKRDVRSQDGISRREKFNIRFDARKHEICIRTYHGCAIETISTAINNSNVKYPFYRTWAITIRAEIHLFIRIVMLLNQLGVEI